jgi:predicted RNA-binding Zn ribbon-like protein
MFADAQPGHEGEVRPIGTVAPCEDLAFRFVGEHLALDFVNTRTVEPDRTTEALPSFRAVVRWLQTAGVLGRADAGEMLEFEHSLEATHTVAALQAFRALLRAMLDELRARGAIAQRYVEAINERLAECSWRRALVRDGDRYAAHVEYRFRRPHDLLAPLANAAVELLAQEDLTRIKRCGSDCCDMYFLDTSRNRSRTWCDMAACGNRAKAAAYYRRSRGGDPAFGRARD